MSELPLDPAASGGPPQDKPVPGGAASPPPPAPPAEGRPRSRRWFVALAWLTLVLFGIFVVGITLSVFLIPQIRRARYGMSEPAPARAVGSAPSCGPAA